MQLRPPALPIINIDPYFSIWSEKSIFENTVHWTGKPHSMCGRVFIDNTEYHFLGLKTPDKKDVQNLELATIDIDAFSTIIIYKNESIKLKVIFTSPMLTDDLYYASRPVAYCHTSYESLDGNEHCVDVEFLLSEELVLNNRKGKATLTDIVDIQNISAIKMGNAIQNPLMESGDETCINWGYLYLAVKENGLVEHTSLSNMHAIKAKANLNHDALFLFAYDDIESIQYFGENLKAYWKKDGKRIETAIFEAANEYEELFERCNKFSDTLKDKATIKGNQKYAELLLLSIRQIMAGHKLVVDKNGDLLYISKECSSNGCSATLDITYPSAPLFLIYNTTLLKAMLKPILDYSQKEEWNCDFAPHDLGVYPLLNGQFYGVRRRPNEETRINLAKQMPVEECGNALILFSAICEKENNYEFAKQHIDKIDCWNKYLINFGLDPENQLCTDDFAGHLAHNVNLSIKAIMGIVAYSRILENLGDTKKSQVMIETARKYADSLVERAKNEDGSFRLAYDKPDTFSLKYNSVWDKIWNTNIFPKSFYEGEIQRYKKELLPYGVPLDSREKYTKSDWLLWAATLCDNDEDFSLFVESLWNAYNTMRTYVPMSDLYYCDTSHVTEFNFRHRTVQGGLFIKLLTS